MTENNLAPLMLTVSQVAKLLLMSENRVYALIHQGVIPSVRFSERGTRIPRQRLEEWVRTASDLPAEQIDVPLRKKANGRPE